MHSHCAADVLGLKKQLELSEYLLEASRWQSEVCDL